MKAFIPILLFSVISAVSYGQIHPDSLTPKMTELSKKLDSDSLQQNLLPDADTLPALEKPDSILHNFNLTADSLQTKYEKTISAINTQSKKITQAIDSLQHFNVPTTKFSETLDSLNQLRVSTVSEIKSKLDSLKAKTIGKLAALDLPAEYKEPLQNLTKSIDDLNLDSDFKIPELKIPDYSLPEMNGIGDFSSKASEIGNLKDGASLPEIGTPVGDVDQLSQQVKDHQDDIQNITEGNLADAEALPETIEEQTSKVEGMDELQKRFDKLAAGEVTDSDAAKEKVMEVAKEAAVDHFAGKEEQLKSAMQKISKYKQKYSSVSSIRDLPKRPPNPMKGKPFIERLVPGLFLQYQQKNFYLLDVNPYLGYKLSGRFTTGLGWNHRYAYDYVHRTFNSRSRIFGPRGYVDFKLGKGFIAHLEGEAMNSFIPSTLRGNPDTGHREWVWSLMTGIKKEYKIYKNLKGTALIQYNLFNRYYKAPYVDRLNSRIGFEYILKRGKKKDRHDKNE